MESKVNGLPGRLFRAAGAVTEGAPSLFDACEGMGVEYAPNVIRGLIAARDEMHLAGQHDCARQIALIESGGKFIPFALRMARWTASENRKEAERRFIRLCRILSGFAAPPRITADTNRALLQAELTVKGFANSEGDPAPIALQFRSKTVSRAFSLVHDELSQPRPIRRTDRFRFLESKPSDFEEREEKAMDTEKEINGLPARIVRAAWSVRFETGSVFEVFRRLGIRYLPGNVRMFLAAREEARIGLHHLHAQTIAILLSEGHHDDYSAALIRWTLIEGADEADAECSRQMEKHERAGFDLQDTVLMYRRSVVTGLVLIGYADPMCKTGTPAPRMESDRAMSLSQSHLRAFQEFSGPKGLSLPERIAMVTKRRDETLKAKEKADDKTEAKSFADGSDLDWLDEEPGKAIPVRDPVSISRRVVIHYAPPGPIKTGAGDEDTRHKMRVLLAREKKIGPAHTADRVDEISSTQYVDASWHAEALSWLRDRHHEAVRNPEKCTHFPPVMLIGPPGCGKTFLLTQLAALVELPAVRMDMSSSLEPWAISGAAWGWRNAQPGVAIRTIIETEYANPVIILDEIEKSGKSQHGGPLNALLPLLQKETAQKYRCPYLEATIDLSRVSWMMLGNSMDGIGGPLRDRVTVFHLRGPRGSEVRHLAQRLLGNLAADQRVVDAAAHAVESGKMSLRGLHRLAREFQALKERPQLN